MKRIPATKTATEEKMTVDKFLEGLQQDGIKGLESVMAQPGLARLLGVQEVVSSNLIPPTRF